MPQANLLDGDCCYNDQRNRPPQIRIPTNDPPMQEDADLSQGEEQECKGNVELTPEAPPAGHGGDHGNRHQHQPCGETGVQEQRRGPAERERGY